MEHSFKWQWFGGNKEQPTHHPWISRRSFPFFVIVAPLEGEYNMRTDCDGKIYTVRPREALIVPPNVLHSVACPDYCRLNYAHLFFRIQDWLDPFLGRSFHCIQTGTAAARLCGLTAELFDARSSFADSLLPAVKIFSLLQEVSFPSDRAQTFSRQRDCMRKTVLFMRKNLQDKLTRTQLAKMAGLSETRFHYVFKDIIGEAPMAYLIRLRLQKAKELLTISDDSISETAARCGWSDPVFFTRQFRQKEGVTPRVFRMEQRAKMLLPQSGRRK